MQELFEAVSNQLDEKSKRLLICAREKGASSWLSSLPIRRLGYAINKQEFRDAIALRYGWKICDLPSFCGCGSSNSIDHALVCKKGGYVSMRHNALRDLEGRLMESVCKDVRIEPALLPVLNDAVEGNSSDQARLDISARGIWAGYEKCFFDVRVTHPTADSHMKKSLEQIYRENENEKKRAYGNRVRESEKGAFTPLVFTTTGGMGNECLKLNKRLAELMSQKTGEAYSDVMRHIRSRLRFALLRSTLVAIRGYRGKLQNLKEDDLSDICFNLIPEARDF